MLFKNINKKLKITISRSDLKFEDIFAPVPSFSSFFFQNNVYCVTTGSFYYSTFLFTFITHMMSKEPIKTYTS